MIGKLRMWFWKKKTHLRTLWDTRDWPPGTIYEDCGYRRLKLISIAYDGDMLGEDAHGQRWTCSFYHCGPEKVK